MLNAPRKLDEQAAEDVLLSKVRYRRLLVVAVLAVSIVSVVPLLVMTGINYFQYQEAFHTELVRPIARFTASGKLSLESFFEERLSALSLIMREKTLGDLHDQKNLSRLLVNVKQAYTGFVDLGIVNADGEQVTYAGPYELQGKSYREHSWFHEVSLRGVHVSDVFMGHRQLPHFVIAVRSETENGETFVLRATIDSEVINRQVRALAAQPSSDAFLVNREGTLQTPSRFYGDVLQRSPLPVPPYSPQAEVVDMEDETGQNLVVGYARIEQTPFVLILLNRPGALAADWLTLRRNLLLFLAISVILILAVVIFGSSHMVNRYREADLKRAALFHKMEYTNKMAAIGRLGAGVAHEINNPLSIINEKAGLLKDLLTLSTDMPPKDKLLTHVNSVLKSVDRCGTITHRLLGFAKHMDVQRDKINLDILLKEVLLFLEKEANYRNLTVSIRGDEDPPTIDSDRGQLQQVFLNIINNAFAAVEDGGTIEITIERRAADEVAVEIADDGMGVKEEHLPQIFDPFFTTKKGSGTGLGLSITYGIVQKLGGTIEVKSKVGEGTCFTVTLPVEQPGGKGFS